MANQARIRAYLFVAGDGVSTTLAVNLITAPFGFAAPNDTSMSNSFTLAAGLLPTAIANVACSGGTTTAVLGLLGAITFTFTGFIPAANTDYMLSLDLLF